MKQNKTNDMYRKKTISIVITMTAICFSAAAQTTMRGMYDFSFIQNVNPWLASPNAAGLGTVQVERTSFAEAFFNKENGGLIPVEGSDDSWLAGARTESYGRISDRIAFHGLLSYSYFHGKNMGGHYFIDPEYNPINFVESTDADRGIRIKETYHLLGGISYSFNEKWAIGSNIEYETADYAKRKDPRTRSRWLNLDITAGTRFSPSDNFSAGLNLQYVRTVETLDGDIFGTTDQQYYTLIDYGGYFGYIEAFDGTNGYVNVGSSSDRYARPMANSFYGGSLQLTFGSLGNVLLFNELTYLRRTGHYGNPASVEVTYCDFFGDVASYSGILDINRGSSMHRIALDAEYQGLVNYENIYRKTTNPGENTVVEYFGQTETLDRIGFSGHLSYTGYLGVDNLRPEWEYGISIDGSYLSSRSTFYPYYRLQEVAGLQAVLHFDKNFLVSKNIFTLALNAVCYTGFGTRNRDGVYASTSSDNHRTNDTYLNRDFEYDTASRVGGTLGFRYTRLFKKISAYIDVRDTYRHTLEKPEFLADGYRNVFTVSVGCAF